MKLKKFLWFSLGLVLSLAISGVVYYHLWLNTIDMYDFDKLQYPEYRHAKIVAVALGMTICTIGVAVVIGWRKSFSIGFASPAGVSVIILIAVGPAFMTKSNYYASFEKEKWNNGMDRDKMARQMIRDNELIGLNKADVINKLGVGYKQEPNFIEYQVYGSDGRLVVKFAEGKVVDCWIWLYGY